MPDRSAGGTPFGTTRSGMAVDRHTLRAGQLTVSVLTLGAVLQDVRLSGTPWPLTLGGSTIAAYEGPMAFFGSVVGPVANRIAGATAVIAGATHMFEANEAGRTTLHGGRTGCWSQVWTVADSTPDRLRLILDLADGTGGFPGNRHITVEYSVLPPATLCLICTATTDAPTLINLAHHGYWNLDGTPDSRHHRLTVAADHVLPVTGALIPTGEIMPVTGTRFDLRTGAGMADAPDLDHNFCLTRPAQDSPTALVRAAELTATRGPRMRISTTEPGLQVYDGRALDTAPHIGLTGAPYGPKAGIALEPQRWPDAPHHAGFPGIGLNPGQTYRQETRFIFDRPD